MGHKIPRAPVEGALKDIAAIVQSHLNLEGFAVIKIQRTSKDDCFAQDVTMRVLEKDFSRKDISEMYWKNPEWTRW